MNYKMLELTFDWTWIKDKQIDIEGNKFSGLIIITDKEDNIIQIYGYELVEAQNEEGAGED